ncbi:MAG: 50S ribosomal protein L28 [Methylacidiphilales bacterium]|nr:50S ribosomal protein L28 [Candidatus Methylacidiphilales bacterium]MDW8349600.1 50S ribosomal protein L28 [Verrucomicrobiae bacterium]
MSRRCEVTGKSPRKGHIICRSGKAKKKGGIGTHVTANTPRVFLPNLKRKRIYIPEIGKTVSLRLSTRALKTITRKGAYATLKKAGLI